MNINILIENKNDYIDYLQDTISIEISKYFVNIAENCATLKDFQKELNLLTKWKNNTIDIKMNSLHKTIEDDNATPQYMQKLIKEIISICTKIKIMEYKARITKLRTYLPSWHEFLYKCCCECANQFWRHPMLFKKNV